MKKGHSFHIPVMGIGYTIDSPLKVAHLGSGLCNFSGRRHST